MFVVELTYVKPLSEVDRHLEAHRAFLAAQYANGTFIASGPKEPRTGGVILAQAASHEALMAALSLDAFRVYDIAEYAITRFHVRAVGPGFEQLAGA